MSMTPTDYGEWLASIKPGDTVVRISRSSVHWGKRREEKVLRVTATMIVLTDGSRFWKDLGRNVGKDSASAVIAPMEGHSMSKDDRADNGPLTAAQLEAIKKMVPQGTKKSVRTTIKLKELT